MDVLYSEGARFVSVTSDGRNIYGCFCEDQDAQDKQLMQYPLVPQVHMEDAPAFAKLHKVPGVQTSGRVHHDTSGPNHEPVVLLERNLYGHFYPLTVGKTI